MKSIIFIALFLIFSCKNIEESNDIINFYKCLLLDSDVVYNHINSFVEAIISLDPIKLVESFTTIYPAITLEVTRCKMVTKNNDNNDIILKSSNNESVRSNTIAEFFKALLKYVTTYIMPFLNPLGINLKKICNDAFPDSFICDLLE